jgi:hypothetical protein
LTGALPGRRAFSGTVDSGAEVCYRAWDESRTRWEIGYGTFSGSTLVRSARLGSSTGGSSTPSYVGQIDVEIVAAAATMLAARGTNPPTAGSLCVAAGHQAAASGQTAVALGGSAVASGDYAVAMGSEAQATHDGSVCVGSNSWSFADYTEQFGRAWRWSGSGYTSSATPADLNDSQFESAPLTIESGVVVAFRALVVGRRDSDNAAYAAEIVGAAVRTGSTPTLLGTPTVTEIGKTAGVTATCSLAMRTSGRIAIQVTGESGQEWYWSAAMTGTRL